MGVDLIHIDGSRIGKRFLDGAFCNFMKYDSWKLAWIFSNGVGNMVANRFAFSIFVCCDIDGFRFFCKFFELFGDLRVVFIHSILGDKFVIFYFDAKTAFWKVSNMSFGGYHLILFAQKVFDSPCFCRRLYNNQILAHSSPIEFFVLF